MPRKIRVLVGKPGLDGHDRGAKVVAAALRDAGMEVVYTGLHQSPEQVVEAAIQEDVDVVALSILSGAHMTLFRDVLTLMRQRGIGDKLLSGGGIIPPEDIEALNAMGVGRLFGPGASTQDIVRYLRDWFVQRHGADSLAAMPEARPALAISAEVWGGASVDAMKTKAAKRKEASRKKAAGKAAEKKATRKKATRKATKKAAKSRVPKARKEAAATRSVKRIVRRASARPAKRR